MGNSDREPGMAKDKKGRANGTGKWSRYERRAVADSVRWADVDCEQIRAIIDALTRTGDAILFARSSDGGVLTATICSGADRCKLYGRTAAEMELELHDATETALAD